VVPQHVASLRATLAAAGWESAVGAAEGARPGDVALLFLGLRGHLRAAREARRRGARVVYAPGGAPSGQRARSLGAALAARAWERAVARASDEVWVESAREAAAWPHARVVGTRGVELPAGVVPSAERDDVVLFASRFEAHKGARAFAEAGRRAIARDPAFVMTGAGRLRFASAGRLDVRGWVGEAERDALLARAKLLVLPSGGAEGVPTVLLEAMARATPVLATPVGGVPDLVEHEKTGYLLDDASPEGILRAARRVLADPRLGDVAAAGRELVARGHSVAAAAARYADALRT